MQNTKYCTGLSGLDRQYCGPSSCNSESYRPMPGFGTRGGFLDLAAYYRLSVPPASNQQRGWEAPVLERLYGTLLDSADTQQNRTRLLAVSRNESGAWLSALPCACAPLGLALDNTTLRIAVGLRLGASLYHPHVCVCGELRRELRRRQLSHPRRVMHQKRRDLLTSLRTE
jgi:hypothetical protein